MIEMRIDVKIWAVLDFFGLLQIQYHWVSSRKHPQDFSGHSYILTNNLLTFHASFLQGQYDFAGS
jgi:hypothetical protein